MRFSIALLAVVVLLTAGVALAGKMNSASIPEEMKQHPPFGARWDESLGAFVLPEPIPIQMPQSNLLGGYSEMLYFDNGLMYYFVPQMDDYFAVTKFRMPASVSSYFRLKAVMVACLNDDGVTPEPGQVVVYIHEVSPDCYQANPEGDQLGETLILKGFVGAPYNSMPDPYNPPAASWTMVELDPVVIGPGNDTEFWIAWDYRPGVWEPGAFYTVGAYNGNMLPGDDMRFFEGSPECPILNGIYGPWLIRGLGQSMGAQVHPFDVDVKPTSCPNPYTYGRETGEISVAIVGNGTPFEVSDIDLNGLFWMDLRNGEVHDPSVGILPKPGSVHFEDVVTPYEGDVLPEGTCTFCTTEGPDDIMDLVMKFDAADVGALLGQPDAGTCVEVDVHYTYNSTVQMFGTDCFRVNYSSDWGKKGVGGGNLGAVRLADANTFALGQNVPNPLRDGTTISFNLPSRSHASLTVYDASGRTIANLVDEELSAGTYSAEWNADVPSGMYFYRLVAGNETASRRMVVVH